MKLHALQYLRALAALVVVYSHACIQVPAYREQLMEFGSFGVDIFFVISGFIMMYIAKPGDTPGAFFINRICRVVPLYWFFTLLMATLLLIIPSVFNNTEIGLDAIIKSLLFIPHFSAAHPGEVWPIVAPGWSLNFEMYFYLLFAISLVITARYRLLFISATILAIFICAKVLNTGGALNEFYSDDIVFEFVFGMLLALAWQKGMRMPSALAAVMIAGGFALLVIHSQGLLFASGKLPGIFYNGIPALMIVAGSIYIRLPVNNIMVLLGDASYALYLSHIFVLGLLRKILPPFLGESFSAALTFVFVSMIICLLASVFVHHYIDNWLLRRERLGFSPILKRRAA